ncbi:MAG TPA: hypothetical protein VG222_08760, partial [Vicinamibacterales bacterium]|nr:hypothetical protein [Vicinamibacterales bacterium]
FAPRSVKSDGDFEDILAADTPAVWTSNRPAKGGDAGAMFATIIERAAKLKADRTASATSRAARPNTKDTKDTKATKGKSATRTERTTPNKRSSPRRSQEKRR